MSGSTLNERLYALPDANWNVTAVADATGTVQERYEYDPYGVTTMLSPTFAVRTASNFGWETTYCGYRLDQATGLSAVRNRFYHPRLGGWTMRDPIGHRGGINSFSYSADRPVNTTDPLGLQPFSEGVISACVANMRDKGDSHRIIESNQPDPRHGLKVDSLSTLMGVPSNMTWYRTSGCCGTVGALIGKPVITPQAQTNCFGTLEQARSEQARQLAAGTCAGLTNCKGKPATPKIFCVTNTYYPRHFSDGLPFSMGNSGRINFDLTAQPDYDYQYFDQQHNVWWGGNSYYDQKANEGKVWDVRLILPEKLQDYNQGSDPRSLLRDGPPEGADKIKVTAYCVTCEASGEELAK